MSLAMGYPLLKGYFSEYVWLMVDKPFYYEVVRSHTINRTNIRDIIGLNSYAFSKEMSPA